ncbi:InlB B-repeat-containing protein [Anaerostipes sp.]|uniref:InlB B-repeat-containing protein n=1 Tax=Anaerostipes sp. TaxID=1872530 RepID=UPI0025C633AD|nr:InlB B-repeat-containing protein [Anaerostipes sp.]MBS7009654.1 InlB B-repeat-containing protein [Anaerostipes sp.]
MRKCLENPGGGICEIQEITPESQTEDTGEQVPENEELSETTPKEDTAEQQVTEEVRTETKKEKESAAVKKPVKKAVQKKKLAQNGQTLLDVGQGDIRITEHGAEGGGLSENETALNPKGYWISGTTTQYNVIVESNVTADLTLDNVDITCDTTKMDCINVSHANVTITLRGKNQLFCNSGGDNTEVEGCALAKDGMDGSLTIQCESADKEGHKCSSSCGSLLAKGNPGIKHAGSIGSTVRNTYRSGTVKEDIGFANFTIKGGNIEAAGGEHCPGIGCACVSEYYSGGYGYTKNIRISGGNIIATGTSYGSGIGSGYGSKVEDLYITGGKITAKGGPHAPGIGASDFTVGYKQSGETEHLEISGGETVVTAIGDQSTNMPGIGAAKGLHYVKDAAVIPEEGYQGYIQDGESEDNYIFADGTPFSEKTEIKVAKFFTMVYFGPYRDANGIDQDTKEQIGANHVISKTGGSEFTEEQLKALTKVTGKHADGTSIPDSQILFEDLSQIEAVNRAKKEGKTGEYPLTFSTENGTTVTVTVYLRGEGTDTAGMNVQESSSVIGANSFQSESGGAAFTEEEVKELGKLKGKDKDGNNISLDDMKLSKEQLDKINDAKTANKNGTFYLTFETPDGKTAQITVTLTGGRDVTNAADSGDKIMANHIISGTGGKEFAEEQLKALAGLAGSKDDSTPYRTDELEFSNPSQLETINAAKTSGKTGDYPLSFQTPQGTEITITVYLRKEGSDNAHYQPGNSSASIGANDIVQPTGGKAFTEDEIIDLCGAKGKDEDGVDVRISSDKDQLDVINAAKTEGKTGSFDLTFTTSGGMEVTVKVTLTGDHKVSFDSDGGSYTPDVQTVEGGKRAVKPKDPQKKGYFFEGWVYTDERGKEAVWDFDTPVHRELKLKAKWKKTAEPTTEETTEKADTHGPDTTTAEEKAEKQGNNKDENWKYKEVTKSSRKTSASAKTGDESRVLWLALCAAGAAGILICKKSRKRK